MAVALRGAAVVPTGTPTTTFAIFIPASVLADDVLFIAVTSRDSTAGSANVTCIDNDTGGNAWAVVTNSADKKSWLFWKRATSATAGKTITVGSCVGSCSGVLKCFSGAITTGNPYTNVSLEANASANETHAGFTPANADSMLCLSVHNYANDNAVTVVATVNHGAMTNNEFLSTGGSDCATAFAHDLATGSTATGNITWAQTNGVTYSIAWAIRPPAGVGYTITSDVASFGITPNAVGLKVDNRVSLEPTTSFVLTPAAIGLRAARKVSLATASYALTPTTVGLGVANRISLTPATFGTTPFDVVLRVAHHLLVEPPLTPPSNIVATPIAEGVTLTWSAPLGFEITPRTVTLTKGRTLPVDTASFTITMQELRAFKTPADIFVSPPLAKPVNLVAEAQGDDGAYLTWDPGPAFAIEPNVVNLSKTRVIQSDVPAAVPIGITATPIPGGVRLEWTGVEPFIKLEPNPVNFPTGIGISADTASYSFTTQNVALSSARRLVANPQSFALTPLSIGLRKSLQLALTSASYTWTPFSVGLLVGGINLPVESGAFLITPNDVDLWRTYVIMVVPASYAWTGQTISLNLGGGPELVLPGDVTVRSFVIATASVDTLSFIDSQTFADELNVRSFTQ